MRRRNRRFEAVAFEEGLAVGAGESFDEATGEGFVGGAFDDDGGLFDRGVELFGDQVGLSRQIKHERAGDERDIDVSRTREFEGLADVFAVDEFRLDGFADAGAFQRVAGGEAVRGGDGVGDGDALDFGLEEVVEGVDFDLGIGAGPGDEAAAGVDALRAGDRQAGGFEFVDEGDVGGGEDVDLRAGFDLLREHAGGGEVEGNGGAGLSFEGLAEFGEGFLEVGSRGDEEGFARRIAAATEGRSGEGEEEEAARKVSTAGGTSATLAERKATKGCTFAERKATEGRRSRRGEWSVSRFHCR